MSNSSEWYVVVDDASPEISYFGSWLNQRNTNARNNTLSVSRTAGSSASFTFTGNFVAVHGAVLYDDADHPPISTYSIDGQTPGIFIPPLSQNNTFATFFVSPKLADSEHTLEITVVNDGVPFFLDSILFNATSVSQVKSGGLQPTIIITTIIAPPSETSSAVPSKAIADSKSVPVGAIVGGVVGGVVLLIAAILAFYFFYLKPKKSRWDYHATSVGDFDDKPEYTYQPHNDITTLRPGTQLSYAPTLSTRSDSESIYSRSSYHPAAATDASSSIPPFPPPSVVPSRQSSLAPSQFSTDQFNTSHISGAGPSTSTAYVPPLVPMTAGQRKALEARSRETLRVQNPVQHTDSGYRFDDGASSTADSSLLDPEVPNELPPTYSER